ncbi:MAG: DUF3053 family protein [Sodalis sp. (in: enterobacteria)]
MQPYAKLVIEPIQKVMPVIGSASSLAEKLTKVEDFLAIQESLAIKEDL